VWVLLESSSCLLFGHQLVVLPAVDAAPVAGSHFVGWLVMGSDNGCSNGNSFMC